MTVAAVDVEALARGVRAGDRTAIGQAITLVESRLPAHTSAARRLVEALSEAPGPTTRVGISGAPGVGKSTFIEALGQQLVAAGHRVGVLAVDPSSTRTRGSVLGDKTRMPALAVDPAAFVRPSPAGLTLGGVARATAQSLTILEAAGFDTLLVETVGVGQSEVAVGGMVDTFVFVTLGRTGDQLQGIKRGIVESAEVIVVNKADGEGQRDAEAAARELASLMTLVSPSGGWVPPVLTSSGLTGMGVAEVWAAVQNHRDWQGEDGLARRRAEQRWELTKTLVEAELADQLERVLTPELRAAVVAGDRSPYDAADAAHASLRSAGGGSA